MRAGAATATGTGAATGAGAVTVAATVVGADAGADAGMRGVTGIGAVTGAGAGAGIATGGGAGVGAGATIGAATCAGTAAACGAVMADMVDTGTAAIVGAGAAAAAAGSGAGSVVATAGRWPPSSLPSIREPTSALPARAGIATATQPDNDVAASASAGTIKILRLIMPSPSHERYEIRSSYHRARRIRCGSRTRLPDGSDQDQGCRRVPLLRLRRCRLYRRWLRVG